MRKAGACLARGFEKARVAKEQIALIVTCTTKVAKKKRARPPLRIRDPAKAEREKRGKWQQHEKGMESMLARAHAEGDAFCIDTAEYIPKFVRFGTHLRQKFCAALQKHKAKHGPGGGISAGPSDSGMAPCIGKPAGLERMELDGAEDGGVPPI